MKFNRYGLQSKISIIIALTVMCVVAVSTLIAMFLTRGLVEEEVYRKALSLARLTAQQLVNERALQQPAELLPVLNQMQSDLTSVKQSDLYVHGPVHKLVASTSPAGEHQELDNIRGIENYFEFERPDQDAITIETPDGDYWIMGTTIRDRGRDVGCLTLKVSKSRSSLLTESLVVQNLVLMLSSLAIVVLVIHIFFLKSVRSPMKEMVQAMETAERGQLDARARVPNRDETGQLAEHLNRMLDRIQNFNTELAGKVEEATQELARRNEELRRINEELFETQKILARSERLAVAGQLAASLAHEIGTPLNSISGHVQLLARQSADDEVAHRRLKIIESQIENIVRTVHQLLAWTRKFELRIGPVDLRRVLEESVLVASPALEHRKIRVRTDWPSQIPAMYGDAGYLQQVFLNLINNSIDAMPGGGQIRLRVWEPAGGGGREVAIEFADTGEGISPENLEHIFEPMFTTKRMGAGAGLGLAICDLIVRQHGGTIQAESVVHGGTQFTIVLPVDCRERVEAAATAVAPAPGVLK